MIIIRKRCKLIHWLRSTVSPKQKGHINSYSLFPLRKYSWQAGNSVAYFHGRGYREEINRMMITINKVRVNNARRKSNVCRIAGYKGVESFIMLTIIFPVRRWPLPQYKEYSLLVNFALPSYYLYIRQTTCLPLLQHNHL